MLTIYFDGLCEWWNGKRNPGGCACGGWVITPHPEGAARGDELAGHAFFCVGEGATNNAAEYSAALEALRVVYRAGYRGEVLLRGDSKLVVSQFSGAWACNVPALQSHLASLRTAATCFAGLRMEWVPRERNAAADAQSRLAYEHYRATHREERRR